MSDKKKPVSPSASAPGVAVRGEGSDAGGGGVRAEAAGRGCVGALVRESEALAEEIASEFTEHGIDSWRIMPDLAEFARHAYWTGSADGAQREGSGAGTWCVEHECPVAQCECPPGAAASREQALRKALRDALALIDHAESSNPHGPWCNGVHELGMCEGDASAAEMIARLRVLCGPGHAATAPGSGGAPKAPPSLPDDGTRPCVHGPCDGRGGDLWRAIWDEDGGIMLRCSVCGKAPIARLVAASRVPVPSPTVSEPPVATEPPGTESLAKSASEPTAQPQD